MPDCDEVTPAWSAFSMLATMSRRERAHKRVSEARSAASERVSEARAAASERVTEARTAATERVSEARTAATERVTEAKAAAEELIARTKPRLRGVTHEWAFFISLVAGAALILAAPSGQSRIAMSIYAFSLSGLLGTSALYHRVNWRRPEIRRWMRRLDHSMIFLLIAGTVTPFALLVMSGPLASALLIAVWAGALAGIVVEVIWVDAPKWVSTIVYVGVGWIGALGFPAIVVAAGVGAGALIAAGGVLYTAGAVVYATQRPDPNPAVFGYHEIFHVLVLAAIAAHFTAIAIYALPSG
jgi:hemolysin III